MKTPNIILFTAIALLSMASQAQIKHHVVQEPTDMGQVKYTVIEEDLSLRNEPNRISQMVIYSKISFPEDHNILKEALRQKNKVRDLSRAGKPLWTTVKNTWSAQDEVNYQAWFSANASKVFNVGSALLADCADVGLLFRWAYAHDKKLPIANTLSSSGKLFGHFSGSSAWDKLPTHADWKQDERFKEALRYLFDNTYTRTIIDDLYPTKINPTYVHPGSVYMIIRPQSGHTQTIYKIDAQNVGMKTLWGNEPAAEAIYESWFMWEPAVRNLFGMWRWPVLKNGVWKLTAAKNMPGYSEEQFTKRTELGENLFRTWVFDGLGLVDFEEAKALREMQTVKDALAYRLNITATGAIICGSATPCDPLGKDYDAYGTTSRDGRMLQAQTELFKTISDAGGINTPSIQAAITKAHIDGILIEGFNYTFKDFILSENLLKNVKSDPNMSFNQRWGLDQFPDIPTQFEFYNQLMKLNLAQRVRMVDDARYYCILRPCNPASNYVLSLNTEKIDKGLAYLADQLALLEKSEEVQGELLEQTYANYRQIKGSTYYKVADTSCEKPDICSMYDIVWKDDGLARVKTWKNAPTDATNTRWGFNELPTFSMQLSHPLLKLNLMTLKNSSELEWNLLSEPDQRYHEINGLSYSTTDDEFNRVKAWKSELTDTVNTRWGL